MLSNFDKEAEYYDLLEQRNQGLHKSINQFLIELFEKYSVESVIDFSSGTGAQAIPISEKGFKVTAVDISEKMLNKAKQKTQNQNITYRLGDMRSSIFGVFDACIAILNSVGYLTIDEFESALRNINNNLNDGGLFIFDNTNKKALLNGMLFEDEFIDIATEYNGYKIVRFVKSDYDKSNGIAKWNWKVCIQKGFTPMVIENGTWVRQTYSIEEMDVMLRSNGFKISQVLDRNLCEYNDIKSFAYLIVARKINIK